MNTEELTKRARNLASEGFADDEFTSPCFLALSSSGEMTLFHVDVPSLHALPLVLPPILSHYNAIAYAQIALATAAPRELFPSREALIERLEQIGTNARVADLPPDDKRDIVVVEIVEKGNPKIAGYWAQVKNETNGLKLGEWLNIDWEGANYSLPINW